jgi:hypothetical protein
MRLSRLFSLAFLVIGLSLWTLAPYGGCSCNNPMGPNAGPTLTPTPTHGPIIDNFNNVNVGDPNVTPLNRLNNWKGTSLSSFDNQGESVYNIAWGPGADAGGPSLHFYGNYGSPNTPGAPGTGGTPACRAPGYPYMAHRIYLNPAGLGGDEDVNLAGGHTGVEFMVKLGGSSNGLVVKAILKELSDFSSAQGCEWNAFHYHAYDVPSTAMSSSAWTLIQIPFANFTYGGSWVGSPPDDAMGVKYAGTNLSQAVCHRNGDLFLMALQFEPLNPGSFPAQAPFDFYIDNIEVY